MLLSTSGEERCVTTLKRLCSRLVLRLPSTDSVLPTIPWIHWNPFCRWSLATQLLRKACYIVYKIWNIVLMLYPHNIHLCIDVKTKKEWQEKKRSTWPLESFLSFHLDHWHEWFHTGFIRTKFPYFYISFFWCCVCLLFYQFCFVLCHIFWF